MIRAIAIDDEPLALQVLQNHANRIGFLSLEKTFTNAREGLAYIKSEKPHALFLDIRMPDHDGIKLATNLPDFIQVIFTTAYAEHAAKGFEIDATDYLLKPVSFARFLQACDKIRVKKHTTGRQEIVVRENGFWHKILLSEIQYVEARGNYLQIVCVNRSYLIRQTMQEIASQLPGYFCRTHKSYIINTLFAVTVGGAEITISGMDIPVSAYYKNDVLIKLGVKE